MDEERRRILGMLAQGTISVDECEELLRALSDRRTEKVVRDVEAAKGKRPIWPYVLIAILAILTIPIWGVGVMVLKGVLAVFAGPFLILLLAFWVWMVVDCVKRRPEDFRLLFTEKHEHEKWVWCAIVFLAAWLGALAYFVVIRQPARSITPPRKHRIETRPEEQSSTPAEPEKAVPQAPAIPKPQEESFTPSPRACSLFWFIFAGLVLIVLPASLLSLTHFTPIFAYLTVSAIVAGIWLLVFWVWMLVDCVARDYREFGTLISSNKSLDKLVWLLLILFLPIIGGLAYHISIRRRPRKMPGTV